MALFHIILVAMALAFEPEAPAELNPLMRRQDFSTASLLESDSKQPFQVESMHVPNIFQQLEPLRRATVPSQVPILASQDVSATEDFFAQQEQPAMRGASREEQPTPDPWPSTTLNPREKSLQLLLTGCVMPQWKKDDYLCLEHDKARAFRDFHGASRKKLEDGEICTVACPHHRFWQVPNVGELNCTQGQLLSQAGTPVVAIRCGTSDYWWNILVGHVIFAIVGGLLSLYICWKKTLSTYKRVKLARSARSEPSVTEEGSADQATPDPAAASEAATKAR